MTIKIVFFRSIFFSYGISFAVTLNGFSRRNERLPCEVPFGFRLRGKKRRDFRDHFFRDKSLCV